MVRALIAFAQRDVDAEILHRRIEKFFDRFGEPMNFVDEQNRPFLGVGKIRHQIFGRHQRRPAGDLHRYAKFARNAGGKRRFAQARRAVEQNMPQRFAPLPGGIERNFQPFRHLALADHIPHPLRPQDAIVLLRHHSRCGNLGGLNNRLAHLAG